MWYALTLIHQIQHHLQLQIIKIIIVKFEKTIFKPLQIVEKLKTLFQVWTFENKLKRVEMIWNCLKWLEITWKWLKARRCFLKNLFIHQSEFIRLLIRIHSCTYQNSFVYLSTQQNSFVYLSDFIRATISFVHVMTLYMLMLKCFMSLRSYCNDCNRYNNCLCCIYCNVPNERNKYNVHNHCNILLFAYIAIIALLQ